MWDNLEKQFLRLIPTFLVIYIPCISILFGLFLVWLLTDVEIKDLTRDPLAVVETELLEIQRNPDAGIHDLANLNIPFYVGAVSNLGILLWCAAASIGLLTFALLRRQPHPGMPPAFFLWSAAISALLMLDDLFLLHERALPLHFGISEKPLFVLYGLAVLLYLIRWRKEILSSDFLVLLIAFGCFAFSLSVDQFPVHFSQEHFFEDGSKFVGIATWAAYHIRTSAQQLVVGNESRSKN